jgi:hypothetical protein
MKRRANVHGWRHIDATHRRGHDDLRSLVNPGHARGPPRQKGLAVAGPAPGLSGWVLGEWRKYPLSLI